MRLLVHEYASARGAGLPPSILAEGRAMRDALCADLGRLAGVALRISASPALPPPPCGEPVPPCAGEDDIAFLLRAAAGADAVWLVAPETDGIALAHARALAGAGIALLGCSVEAIALASSKSRLLARLAAAGLAVAPTWPLAAAPLALHPLWAVKPDRGCGCEGARRLSAAEVAALRRGEASAGRIAQPWLAGEAMSLSLRVAGGDAELLSVNRQHIEVAADGALSLRGLTRCVELPQRERLAALARRIAAAVPGLRGFVGVDFMLGEDGGATLLELNPRPTLAYAGLSARLGRNLAADLLADFAREACHA
ncbi:MAG TPA: ATP-grasp domain-containing protein [Candidatus Desulfobacillus sp.]|nr:ATP-grasp domain-containing protein [Candidatus Desulfobacillus sp.]